jgi:hypothetical protein
VRRRERNIDTSLTAFWWLAWQLWAELTYGNCASHCKYIEGKRIVRKRVTIQFAVIVGVILIACGFGPTQRLVSVR